MRPESALATSFSKIKRIKEVHSIAAATAIATATAISTAISTATAMSTSTQTIRLQLTHQHLAASIE